MHSTASSSALWSRLIGFAVATVLVMGWRCGNMFTYVFLTLGMLGVVAFTILVGGQVAAIGVVTGAVAFCVIWALRYLIADR